MYTSEMGQLQAINRLVGSVAKRDLTLLKKIDKAIDTLCESRGEMDLLTKVTYGFIDELKGLDEPLPDVEFIIRNLEKSRETLGGMHAELSRQCEVIKASSQIHPDDALIESYCGTIDSVAALHNAVNALAWAVGEHNADFDKPSGKAYDSVDEMFAAMGV